MKSRVNFRRFGLVAAAVALLGVLCATPRHARAENYQEQDDNPLRIIYYFVYPAGKFLEYTVTRPLKAASTYVAPFHHIDEKRSVACTRERPARSCTNTIR